MNPLLAEALGSIFRSGLILLAGYLVKAGIWTNSQAETYVAAAALFLVALLWSLWQKYNSRFKLLVALATPQAQTEAVLEERIKTGMSAVAVTTPKNEHPTLLG